MTTARRTYVLALALAVGTVLLLVLTSGALGIVGDGDRDVLYLAVPAVALVGTLVARFRAAGMALAMAATAVTTVVVALVAVVLVVVNDEGASVVDAVGVSAMFAVMFAASAWLFRRSDLAA